MRHGWRKPQPPPCGGLILLAAYLVTLLSGAVTVGFYIYSIVRI